MINSYDPIYGCEVATVKLFHCAIFPRVNQNFFIITKNSFLPIADELHFSPAFSDRLAAR